VEGKITYIFTLADGRQAKGHDLLEGEWPWRDHLWKLRVRYVWWRAISLTYIPLPPPGFCQISHQRGQNRVSPHACLQADWRAATAGRLVSPSKNEGRREAHHSCWRVASLTYFV
jgi:hypothetical protein